MDNKEFKNVINVLNKKLQTSLHPVTTVNEIEDWTTKVFIHRILKLTLHLSQFYT